MGDFFGPFTANDLERIWLNNLSPIQQAEVVCFFYDVSPVFFGVNQVLPQGLLRQSLESLVGLLPGGGTAVKVVQIVENLAPTVQARCERFRNSRILIRPSGYDIRTRISIPRR